MSKDFVEVTDDIYEVITHGVSFDSRIIYIAETIKNKTFKRFSAAMALLEHASSEPITIEINSEGGDINAAMAIIGRMKASKCDIIVVGLGQVMSAAVLIIAAGDERAVSKYTTTFWHESQGQIKGSFSKMKAELDQEHNSEEFHYALLEEFTSTPAALWKKLAKDETYLTPQDCLQYGLVDRIV